MAQTKPKAAQFYGVPGNGTAGQVLISDGNGGMTWGANTEEFTVSWNTPTGQGLTYTQPSPQSSVGTAGSAFPTTTFTVTKSDTIISGTATIAGLPTGITATQVITGSGIGNTLTVTLSGVFPGADSLNTDLTLSGLTLSKTVSWATPTGQSLTYTQPSPQSSTGNPGTAFPTTTFTATKSGEEISGTATIAGLPTGITASQSISGSGANNVLTVTLSGVFPDADSLNTALTLSGLTVAVPITPLTVDYLVVAGGGGSGTNFSGGGGAGGLRTSYGSISGGGSSSESTPTLSTNTAYTVTIGGGGGLNGQGGNSTFNTITSTGGGKGAGWQQPTSVGGSGGGQGVFNPGTYFLDGAAGTAGQGYKGGGYYFNNLASAAGGGGGAGQAGQHGLNPTGGYGGDGIAVSILSVSNATTASVGEVTGSLVYYAGGGGGSAMNPSGSVGGAGGTGGGGNGANDTGGANSTNEAGTANTGGGAGGGSRYSGQGKTGGSGVIILRYPDDYAITVGSGITQASGSPFTDGSNKISVFTAGTGNIQFN